MSAMHLSAIYRYPIKSARGHYLDSAVMDRFGIVGDRRWMLVDAAGRFLSQRRDAALARLEVEPLDGALMLRFDGEELRVEQPTPPAQRLLVTVWDSGVAALLADARANAWLSERFGAGTRLVYCPDDALRGADPDYAPLGQLIAFSDGFPLLLVSSAAVDALNERLPAPVSMDRFRPNLVVSGAPAHAEDGWRRLRIGDAELALVKPCSRCVIPSIDQQTGARDPHINRALAAYRRRDGIVYFGMNAVATPGTRFEVGDALEVLD
jgi:uncharacterized protein YcbX